MPEQEPLASLLADLRSLRRRDRRAILAALSESERGRIAAFSGLRAQAPPMPVPEPILSAWLHARLDDAAGSSGPQITAAARDALRTAARGITDGEPVPSVARSRSLLGALGSLLAGAGALP